MITKSKILDFQKSVVIAIGFMLFTIDSHAAIDGITGTVFNLSARADHLSTPDGGSVLFWSYAETSKTTGQYPGPTLIVNEGDVVTVNLSNELDVPVSVVFPGQGLITTVPSGDNPGLLTEEVLPGGGPVAYTFTAANPGTYTYHSGTRMELELEMGLVGALIVRPLMGAGIGFAYNHADTQFDSEFLFLLTDMDPGIHLQVESGDMDSVDFSGRFPNYWFINGRAAPDTMKPVNSELLPKQPYNCLPRMHPGDRMLLRIAGGGADLHPFHHHGNHSRVIARNGRMLSSSPGAGADMSNREFTIQSVPGQTVDSIFEWTGEELGWDIYGHQPEDPLEPFEYAADHGKVLPTVEPDAKDLVFGPFFSGSPYLGSSGPLKPGDGGFNLNNGIVFMWHSHNEREMVNRGIFPGGMMTMLIIEHPSVVINP
ncbi:hypothetical protein AU255_00255 [Methyloprofundus sedimenti]|uniref:Plastocyanin-like domain-containing protein n=1 Tax=Methyloprofundus sedimenti TaxID=1420851 RepID=A0A1V8M4Q8_9GAMM|nr:multicopper oxidase domain-containing protein [Methyloprofundus sedimenti]OQK16383.1 hypothetical protein AU255_00255 [Methyloprofundus sedimenti]